MEVRYASSNKDAKHYTTDRLREEFLVQELFKADDLKLVYFPRFLRFPFQTWNPLQ